jgi:hypothetical protein
MGHNIERDGHHLSPPRCDRVQAALHHGLLSQRQGFPSQAAGREPEDPGAKSSTSG